MFRRKEVPILLFRHVNQNKSSLCTASLIDRQVEQWEKAKPYESIPGPTPLPLIGNSWRLIYGADFLKLSQSQDENWGKFRAMVNPIMMQAKATNFYIPTINEITDDFITHVKRIKEKCPNNIMPANFMDEINKWAFESITAITLDTRLGILSTSPSKEVEMTLQHILKMFHSSLEVDYSFYGPLHRQFNTPTWKRYVESQDFLTNMIIKLIDEAKAKIDNDPHYINKSETDKSIFEKLIAKDKKIYAILMTLDGITAGTETTAKVVGAIIYYIAKHPDIQTKLRKELKFLLPNLNTIITKEILEEAKYLRACIKEGLRIAPVAHSSVRWITKDMVIGGYQVPAGVIINLPHLYMSIGTDENFYSPKQYIPERWLRKGDKSDNATFATMPYGFGARSCIGKRLAQMELEMIIAKMVRNFIMQWPHKEMRFAHHLVYSIADPLRVQLHNVTS